MRKLIGLVVLLAALAAPRAHAGAVPEFTVTAAGIVAHDISTGYKHPFIFAAESILGPHYGPLYIGGIGTSQGQGVGLVIPLATYVGQGRIPKLTFLRGVVFQVGIRKVSDTGSSYYFGIGVGR